MASTLQVDEAVARFAAFCAQHVSAGDHHELAVVDGIIKPLQEEFRRLFGKEPSNFTVVMVVCGGCLYEVPGRPGLFVHKMTPTPKFVFRALEFLDVAVEAVVVNGYTVDAWKM